MKIAISAKGKEKNSEIDPRFGRCSFFLFIDSEKDEFEALVNPATEAAGGAGIQAAQLMVDKGVEVVITGNVGPNAFQTLNAAKIKIVGGAFGTVREALEKYKNGELKEFSAHSVPPHFGMGNKGEKR